MPISEGGGQWLNGRHAPLTSHLQGITFNGNEEFNRNWPKTKFSKVSQINSHHLSSMIGTLFTSVKSFGIFPFFSIVRLTDEDAVMADCTGDLFHQPPKLSAIFECGFHMGNDLKSISKLPHGHSNRTELSFHSCHSQ